MESIKIIGISILLAILYGIYHDLITVNISIEYFTLGYPKIIESESRILLALLWGVIATWWVGLILGIFISVASRIGNYPKFGLKDVIQPILKLILIMSCTATIAGIISYLLAKEHVFYLVDSLANQIENDRHHLFLTAGWSHTSSYIVGFIGGIIIILKIWGKRKRIKVNSA